MPSEMCVLTCDLSALRAVEDCRAQARRGWPGGSRICAPLRPLPVAGPPGGAAANPPWLTCAFLRGALGGALAFACFHFDFPILLPSKQHLTSKLSESKFLCGGEHRRFRARLRGLPAPAALGWAVAPPARPGPPAVHYVCGVWRVSYVRHVRRAMLLDRSREVRRWGQRLRGKNFTQTDQR